MLVVWRQLLTTQYTPDQSYTDFTARAAVQEGPLARVALAVLDAQESRRRFGVDLAARNVQPVFLRIESRSREPLRLHALSIDPGYYTPLEAAAVNHFSFTKRLTAFGAAGWIFLPVFALAPLKAWTAAHANQRMNACFQNGAFRLRPIDPGQTVEGFVFTNADFGTKEVHVRLLGAGTAERPGPESELVFSVTVPGFAADHHGRDLEALARSEPVVDLDRQQFIERMQALPATTTDRRGTGTGDPVNLVVLGTHQTILSAFAGRWDETETISMASCWKTCRAFLLGSQYRYSPVSPLYLFGRSQDLALQRIRRSIHERLHLRLWLSPLRYRGLPIWVGQVSRDIGVRFTTKTWNLSTHRIDPDIDESRDYVVEDLLEAGRIDAAAFFNGVGACDRANPRRNLTGDPYHTDGRRAAIMLSPRRTTPRFVLWE